MNPKKWLRQPGILIHAEVDGILNRASRKGEVSAGLKFG